MFHFKMSGGSQNQFGHGRKEKNSVPVGNQTLTILPVASNFTASLIKSLCNMIMIQSWSVVVRFDVFMVVKIQVEVFLVVMPCSDAVGYQRFGGPCCFLQVSVLWNTGILPQCYTIS